ncbi:MAG: hypothetical protein AAF725_17115 [Acidobacteriota bacterium]
MHQQRPLEPSPAQIRRAVLHARAALAALAFACVLAGGLEWVRGGHLHVGPERVERHYHAHLGAHHHHPESPDSERPGQPADSSVPAGSQESSGEASLYLASFLLLSPAEDSFEFLGALPNAAREPAAEPPPGALLSSRHDPASRRGPPAA